MLKPIPLGMALILNAHVECLGLDWQDRLVMQPTSSGLENRMSFFSRRILVKLSTCFSVHTVSNANTTFLHE